MSKFNPVYYEKNFGFGYTILSKDMHPMQNCYVSANTDDECRNEVRRRWKCNDLEFIYGLSNYYK